MKPRYKINQVVKIKATGEKVMIMATWNQDFYKNPSRENEYYVDYSKGWIKESELKPYCPSRTGTRDPKTGRFVSNGHRPTHNMKIVGNWNVCNDCFFRERIDSKQRNYQKIEKLHIGMFDKYDEVKEKINEIIDELGRRV